MRSIVGSAACRRTTRGLRPPSLPRLVGRRDRREPRRPDGNDQVADPLRNVHPPRGTRGRCPDDQHRIPGAVGMNENEFDLASRAWLDDGPTRMSDRAVLATLEEIHTTRQRRVLWPAWRATPVKFFARAASAAVLVVAIGLLAINVLPRLPDGSRVGGPSPTADRRHRRPRALMSSPRSRSAKRSSFPDWPLAERTSRRWSGPARSSSPGETRSMARLVTVPRSTWRRARGASSPKLPQSAFRARCGMDRHRDDRVGRPASRTRSTSTAPPTTPRPTPGGSCRRHLSTSKIRSWCGPVMRPSF